MPKGYNPFAVFRIFGDELLTTESRTDFQYVIGVGFHIVNGIGFVVAYARVIRRPGYTSGLLWALALEGATILLYPSWLQLQELREFLSGSVLGHVAFGLTLVFVLRQNWPKVRLATNDR